jgi:hypothetical protein
VSRWRHDNRTAPTDIPNDCYIPGLKKPSQRRPVLRAIVIAVCTVVGLAVLHYVISAIIPQDFARSSDIVIDINEAEKNERLKEEAEETAVRGMLLELFQPYARHDLRLDRRPHGDLHIYLNKTDFQSIPFPDRKGFIEGAGKLWCGIKANAKEWLPSLKIYDIRTGETLGGYSCTFSWTYMSGSLLN